MNDLKKVLLSGSKGRMGQAIQNIASEHAWYDFSSD